MSISTPNGFLKPELSDPADITAYNSNWDMLDDALSGLYMFNTALPAFSEDGINYSVHLTGNTAGNDGWEFTIVPNMTNTVANPVLKVDLIGTAPIRLPLSGNTSATIPCPIGFLVKDYQIRLRYDETHNIWRIVDKQKTSASDLYGSVPIANGGHGGTTAAEARANLGVLPDILVEGEHYGTLAQRPKAGTKGRLFFVTM